MTAELAEFEGRKLRVPHVAAWSSEAATIVRTCRYSGRQAFFGSGGAQGRGTPCWGEMSYERQRRSMWERRCQVCDNVLAPENCLLMIWEGIQHDSEGHPVVMEPWICESCQNYAYAVCPGIARTRATYVIRNPKVDMIATTARLKDGRVAVSYFKARVLDAPLVLDST